jgi:hypothetical protein
MNKSTSYRSCISLGANASNDAEFVAVRGAPRRCYVPSLHTSTIPHRWKSLARADPHSTGYLCSRRPSTHYQSLPYLVLLCFLSWPLAALSRGPCRIGESHYNLSAPYRSKFCQSSVRFLRRRFTSPLQFVVSIMQPVMPFNFTSLLQIA